MKIEIQRLRNLTTGRLHTEVGHIYQDLEAIIGETGLMTHMLPRVMDAIKPWLEEKVHEPKFWDGEYDTNHIGNYKLPTPTKEDRAKMLERFKAMPNPLAGKDVLAVQV